MSRVHCGNCGVVREETAQQGEGGDQGCPVCGSVKTGGTP